MIETMIGNSIANQCSPVLMDVKPSNLLILTREEEEGFLEMEDILEYGGSASIEENRKASGFCTGRTDWKHCFSGRGQQNSEILWVSDRRVYTLTRCLQGCETVYGIQRRKS